MYKRQVQQLEDQCHADVLAVLHLLEVAGAGAVVHRHGCLFYTSASSVGLPAGAAGVLQGELVLNAWENQREKLDRNGDGVIQYVMLEGEPGHQDALLRTEYCISTMTKAGVATEKLASDAANWQRGQAAIRMRQWLREFGAVSYTHLDVYKRQTPTMTVAATRRSRLTRSTPLSPTARTC